MSERTATLNGQPVSRGGDTIFISLPIDQWRPAMDGTCLCPVCEKDRELGHDIIAFWDTLAVSAKQPRKGVNDYAWAVHMPGRYCWETRQEATQLHRKPQKDEKGNFKTQFACLKYTQIAPGLWQFIMTDDDGSEHQIGQQYPTRRMIEADVVNFAKERGFDR